MAQHHVDVLDPRGHHAQACAEGQVVHDDRVRCDLVDDLLHGPGGLHRFPHEVIHAFLGLESQRLNHA